jgi:rod shape-determining protein MreC
LIIIIYLGFRYYDLEFSKIVSQKFFTPKLIKLVVVVAICLLLVFLNPRGLFSGVRFFFLTVAHPFQKTFYILGEKTGNTYDFLGSIGELKGENQKLEKENNSLAAEIAQLKDEKKENDTLREQLGLLPRDKYDLEAGYVIGQDPQKLGSWLMIDKGSASGIKPDMLVIYSDGILIGKVKEVYPYNSKVELLTAASNAVNAMDQETNAKGIVRGEYGLGIVLDMVSQTDTINQGDTVVTSGLGSNIPRGLLIGKINEVKTSEDRLFQQAIIIPRVKYSNLDLVFVIKK